MVKAGADPEDQSTMNKIRLVTATSLFDGHDASINIMRRIAQASGAEVIHLGHNRSAGEIVDAAIEEDAHGIAITSYQGGHLEFFRYAHDLLGEKDCGHIKLFGGGGGVILPHEIEELQSYGVCRIYSPDDGRELGLEGMVRDMLSRCDTTDKFAPEFDKLSTDRPQEIARALTAAENDTESVRTKLAEVTHDRKVPVLGITGTGGAGKSSLIDEIVRRFLIDFDDRKLAILSVDPSQRRTGGALLGDRIRMNSIQSPRVYMRSMATRQANLALAESVGESIEILKRSNFDLIILETSGIGQSDTEVVDFSDLSLYVMTPDYGAATQLEKIDMLDYADLVAINKFDRRGAKDALRDVTKQIRRNRKFADDDIAVHGTMASQFNDPGTNSLYKAIIDALNEKVDTGLVSTRTLPALHNEALHIIPPANTRYLAEIAGTCREYDTWAHSQSSIARQCWRLQGAIDELEARGEDASAVHAVHADLEETLDQTCREALANWPTKAASYEGEFHTFKVRGKDVRVQQTIKTLSNLEVAKVALPDFKDPGELLHWILRENVPGEFPFAAGVYPFKRENEDPTRMFAGEGGPERTNRRFHYISRDQKAKRLSTAFDSVTLYGENPGPRPDIYGKVGNAGVSVCSLDDAKKLYSGFNLSDSSTSVSMTINGPAPMILAFFINAAIDQQCELHIKEHGLTDEVEAKIDGLFAERNVPRPRYDGKLPDGHDGLGLMLLGVTGDQVLPRDTYEKIREETLKTIRGTVQADILKEDQAQNTCIFSSEFALRLMGDIQQYFIDHDIRNFYSVSISGYHIAEAGANPITQLAFTLANSFTYVEYYLSRQMDIDAFAPNLSFFFSNGLDPEYAVIGRVARRIWAKALKHRYEANERSQKLKYHIQTSGRSLHAQEISFNDIRTTLQALYAIYDNCQSLHTNAYDEAITTPTEESVRRAIAIQLIINKELGLAANENPLQGSFSIEELSDLVEEAVLEEFERISERGGVLGAMETMYQRGKIQEESLRYESLKNSGELPLVGVNTFLGSDGSPIQKSKDVMRSTEEERDFVIESLSLFHERNASTTTDALETLKRTALEQGNVFDSLMEASKFCSLGQLTDALYEIGGQYRRNM